MRASLGVAALLVVTLLQACGSGQGRLSYASLRSEGAGAMYAFLDHKQRFASATIISAPLFDVDSTMSFPPWRGGSSRRSRGAELSW